MPEHFADALCFDGIARRSAGTMCFKIRHALAIDLRIFINRLQKPLLSRAVRKCNPVRTAVGVDARCANHRVNGIAVAKRRIERLDDHHRPALASDVAVAFGIENLAAAVLREHVRLREPDKGHRRQKDVDAPDNRHRKVLRRHRPARFVQRHKA